MDVFILTYNNTVCSGEPPTLPFIQSFFLYFQAFERIKLIQLDKYYKAQSDFEREQIICDPLKIFHLAFANVKPVFRLLRHIKSGTIYMVRKSTILNATYLI